jgi:hypothetical protein
VARRTAEATATVAVANATDLDDATDGGGFV